MARPNQAREEPSLNNYSSFKGSYTSINRIDLNDLLKRREREKKIEKKTNLLIFSGTLALVAVVVVILSL